MCEINQQVRKQAFSQAKERKMLVPIALVVLLTVLASALAVLGQVNSGSAAGANNKEVSSADTQDKGQSKLKPKRDIRVTITPIRYSEQVFDYAPTDRYKVGEPVRVQVEMTSLLPQSTEVIIGNHFYQNRLRLLKDGQPVPYRSELPKKLKKADQGPAYFGSMRPYELKPSQTIRVGHVSLDEWYGSLEPGRYELTLQHRFLGKEQPAESNTVTFEVIP